MNIWRLLSVMVCIAVFTCVSVALARAAPDVAHGKQVFATCAPCHTTNETSRVGPGLGGIVGREAGTMPGFHYSRAMKNAKIVWDDKSLNAYIAAPQSEVPGNIMPFSGIQNAKDRADLVAYLDTLK